MRHRSFRTSSDFRAWLDKHHDTESELWLRLFKVQASQKGIGYREALDESLCFGWIDGVRKSLDADSYVQRFTPRQARSNWSAVNLKRVQELEAEGRMHDAGRAALQRHDGRKPPYSFESETLELAPEFVAKLQRHRTAWKFWKMQPPGVKRRTSFWVMSAKREETRARRFAVLLENAKEERRVPGV